MKRKDIIASALTVLVLVAVSVFAPITASATSTATENIYYFENFVNAGKDTGYSEENQIKEGDPHSGWRIGRFCVDGYTRRIDKDGTPIFLKTVGDTIKLWFELEQDITKLNDDDSLSINDDKNGYDEYFGIEKTDFGRGTLIIRKTDYQNHTETYPPYIDYLAGVTVGATTEVLLCEEGDYEVALDYEVRRDRIDLFGWNPLPAYHNYRIYFKFSVRNGNCMAYPFDVATKAELSNGSITENGFYLDLANSRNLSVDIKKEVRIQGAEGLAEDTRFNRPAKDHEEFTDEGIYTITAKNEYTNQTTTKVIYVGTDDVLKAYVATGGTKTIHEIEQLLADGAKVDADGTLILNTGVSIPHVTEPSEETLVTDNDFVTEKPDTDVPNEKINIPSKVWLIAPVLIIVLVVIIVVAAKKNKKHGES